MAPRSPLSCFPTSREDASALEKDRQTPQTESASYRLAYTDMDFLTREDLRPIRLQLELLKPELVQQEHNIEATVVVFGSSRIFEREKAQQRLDAAKAEAEKEPQSDTLQLRVVAAENVLRKSCYYEEAHRLAGMLSKVCHKESGRNIVVVTGGGPGIMEAANRGAHEAGAENIGLNIVLPHEQAPNEYITPELCFQFHYFSLRKMHFLLRAQALVAFPGGFGTLDELFETLTLIQTKKIRPLPVLLFGREFWEKLINFDMLVEEGVISQGDLDIFQFVETAEEAVAIIDRYYNAESSDNS